VDVSALAALQVAGRAVLLHTSGDAAWGRADYATDAPYLAEAGAHWLAGHGARLVGIDSVSIDDIKGGGRRPAHSILLQAGIPVVEHLTGLGRLPPSGFWFTAAPIPLAEFGSSPSAPTRRYLSRDIRGRRHRMTRRAALPNLPKPRRAETPDLAASTARLPSPEGAPNGGMRAGQERATVTLGEMAGPRSGSPYWCTAVQVRPPLVVRRSRPR
jgi:hypothetical protein